ncbi:hypothetical protein HAD_13014 [Hyphomonas adhaerens MHS-3]|uniref:Uncharacterized protein n=1 Tax=Hyphomonas adhaerens MHS-3 TaxID=1280949 RepID=A0A069E247_9PROT|nr:hypothetical protein [Hyphomonas adhaerens]KCZ83525.1 hypothetical protein HAD_13014 [Hyphomonas adhaerens MHS-3]
MWVFPKSGPFDSNRKSKLDQFFSGQNAATSVVREAIQNSLDAALDKSGPPVVVYFKLFDRQWADFQRFISTEDEGLSLNDHTKCDDLGRYAEDFEGKTIRCLSVEDYGTRGLTGSTDKNKALSGSNFVGFWWNEGITGKGSGTLGNHGVGKTTLTRISGMSTIWAVTKRSDDDREFLIGFSNLPFHQLDDCSYLGYGRFGKTASDGSSFMPVEDGDTIASFAKTFSLDRAGYGLSVLIPAVHDNVGHDSILEALLDDYYWPILRGRLNVSITDEISGQATNIDAESLNGAISKIKDKKKLEKTNLLVNKARQVMQMKEDRHPNYFIGMQPAVEGDDEKSKRANLKASCFSEDNLQRIKDQYEKGHMVGVQFGVDLVPIKGDATTGIFEVFLQAASEKAPNGISQFLRNGIILSEQKDNISGRFGCCFIIVEDKEMSDYLGLAEGPAHTKWLIGTLKDHKKFKSDWPLRFAMDAARELYRILVGEDEEKDKIEGFAADIFSIKKPSQNDASEAKKQKGKKTKKPEITKRERATELVRIDREQARTGFSIVPVAGLSDVMAGEDITLPLTIEIETAYLSVGGNARSFKDYTPIDFDFSSTIGVEITPEKAAKVLTQNGNKLVVEVQKPEFKVVASGFDRHRDLLIKTEVKVGG